MQALLHKETRCIKPRWKCKTRHIHSLNCTRLCRKIFLRSSTREKAELLLKIECNSRSKFGAKWLLNKWNNLQRDINSEKVPQRKWSSHQKSSSKGNTRPRGTPAGKTVKSTKVDKNIKPVKMDMSNNNLPKCPVLTIESHKILLLNMWTCDPKEVQATTNITLNRTWGRILLKTKSSQARTSLKELDLT